MKTLLKGGTVVGASGSRRADVLIENEIIAKIGEDLRDVDARVVDCAGMLLLPGFIDAHTHFDLDVCNTTTADDFESGSRSALLGGTTTVIDFACPNKGETLQYGLDLWHKKAAGRTFCDYSFHMTIDDWNEEIIAEIPAMFRQGISSFKMYLTYPAMMIGDKNVFLALQELKKHGGIAGVHCENADVIDALIAQAKEQGKMAPGSHPRTRPAPLEAEAVDRLLKMAEVADVPVVVVHLSSAAGYDEVLQARARGQKVFVETCPQYLLLDDSRYDQADYLESAKFVCAPPLRKAQDQEVLWKALADGGIQTVCTDHCSFTLQQKMAGQDDFTKIPGGLPGVETRGILLYTYGVAKGRISKEKMAEVLSENPAKLYGLYPRKGILAEGSDADIVVYDPAGQHKLTHEALSANVDYSPFEGFDIAGSVRQVWLRGTLAAQEGRLLQEAGGIFLPRGKCRL
ncbi:MAG: dihydropyrimidinase [Ruminococcaceae bacterium]|nr:dihydropyrimidinase [Oscillospiraceae bacterium]